MFLPWVAVWRRITFILLLLFFRIKVRLSNSRRKKRRNQIMLCNGGKKIRGKTRRKKKKRKAAFNGTQRCYAGAEQMAKEQLCGSGVTSSFSPFSVLFRYIQKKKEIASVMETQAHTNWSVLWIVAFAFACEAQNLSFQLLPRTSFLLFFFLSLFSHFLSRCFLLLLASSCCLLFFFFVAVVVLLGIEKRTHTYAHAYK